MAEIIDARGWFEEEEPDLDAMDCGELQSRLKLLRERIAELDAREPENMQSEEYEVWGEAHEDLEDRVDEILDRLDELK